MKAVNVRTTLIDALRLDFVGPRPGYAPHADYAEEVLTVAPSKWYLTGFLVPYDAPIEQRTDDDGPRAVGGVLMMKEGERDNKRRLSRKQMPRVRTRIASAEARELNHAESPRETFPAFGFQLQ